ncbi:hypothetical protein ACRQ5B_03560 [Pseudarthrobacter sp. L19]|uniref:hypothetical protein n=1 Tax=Pseudarthrobacter sp. L19 TaxID=3423951 RepID=UPI003D78DB14
MNHQQPEETPQSNGAGHNPATAPLPGSAPRPVSAPQPVTTSQPQSAPRQEPAQQQEFGQGWGAPSHPAGAAHSGAAHSGQPGPTGYSAQAAPSPATPGWGAPSGRAAGAQADKPWTVRRALAVGGVAAVIAVGAGAGVYALTSSSAAASGDGAAAGGPQFNGQGMPGGQQGGQAGGSATGRGGFGPEGVGGMAGGLSAAVHAEYVVLDGTTYTSMAEQLGTVTEVSSTSVTVKSADGFTRSYALGDGVTVSAMQQRRQQSGGTGGTGSQLSVADIVSGATVRLTATKDGAGYSAKSVMLVAATAAGGTGAGQQPGDQGGGQTDSGQSN